MSISGVLGCYGTRSRATRSTTFASDVHYLQGMGDVEVPGSFVGTLKFSVTPLLFETGLFGELQCVHQFFEDDDY